MNGARSRRKIIRSRAARVVSMRHRIPFERSQPKAAEREAYLRSLLGLPTTRAHGE